VAEMADEFFGGSCMGLVKCLFDQGRINGDEVGRVREMLDRAERGR